MPRHAASVLTTRAIRSTRRSQYVCQACLEVARSRAFSATTPAAEPLWKRMRNSILGTKEEAEKVDKKDERIQAAKVAQSTQVTTAADQPALKEVDQEDDFTPKKIGDTDYQVARTVDPETERLYEESQTGAKLRSIGGEKWVKEQRDSGLKYQSRVSSKRKRLSNEELALLLRHIFVEVHVLVKNGREAMDLVNSRKYGVLSSDVTQGAKINVSEDGQDVDIVFAEAQHEKPILDNILEDGSFKLDQQKRFTDLLMKSIYERKSAYTNSADSMAWMRASFTDPSIKLAVLKYITQLTGLRPSDLQISFARTFEDFYKALEVKVPTKKLADAPQMKALKLDLPNVTVYSKRRGILNKESEVGRWKLIEKELLDRGLPLGVGQKAMKSFKI